MENLLKKASEIIREAKRSTSFIDEHGDNVIGWGERFVDYVAMDFDLGNDYHLILDFKDFQLNDFSLINKRQLELVDFLSKRIIS